MIGIAAAILPSVPAPMVTFVPQHLVLSTDLADHAHPSNCGYAKMSYIWYYSMSRSPLNKTGKAWPTGYYPFGSARGACNTAR